MLTPPPGAPKTPGAGDARTGQWRGLYAWDCGNGMRGTEPIAFTIDGAASAAVYTGSATYLGGTADTSVGRFSWVLADEGTWLPSLDGAIIETNTSPFHQTTSPTTSSRGSWAAHTSKAPC